jgi:hypothetical protein
MKKRLLPIGLISFVLIGLIIFAYNSYESSKENTESGASIAGAMDYFSKIRNNKSGILKVSDVLKARKELAAMDVQKSSELEWHAMGPVNIGGRVRALIFDKQDETGKTVYAGGVNGGLFKSVNFGVTWTEVPTGDKTLAITTMCQDNNGDLYIGTGEGLYSDTFSAVGDIEVETGFVGTGIYKFDTNETLSLIDGTDPVDNPEFAFINEICFNKNGTLMVATNDGLRVKKESGWTYAKLSDGTNLTGIAWDIKVGENGYIYTAVDGNSYRSTDGNTGHFEMISGDEETNLPAGSGRVEFAIAPSNEAVVYASVSNTNGSLIGIFKSYDKGQNWSIILNGGSSTYNIFSYGNLAHQGNYDNTISVYPDDDSRILVGGRDLLEGISDEYGNYDWTYISSGVVEAYNTWYLHYDIHSIAFRPTGGLEVLIATDGGVFYSVVGTEIHTYQARNKGLNISQFYSVAVGTKQGVVLGGTQDNGPQLIAKNIHGDYFGKNIYHGFASDGGNVAMSLIDNKLLDIINPPGIFYSITKNHINTSAYEDLIFRSNNLGVDASLNLFDSLVDGYMEYELDLNTYLMPILHKEFFDVDDCGLNVEYIVKDSLSAGTTILVPSNCNKYPFEYVLPADVVKNDTLYIQDRYFSRTFIAFEDEIFMTYDGMSFDKYAEWVRISFADSSGVEGNPTAMAYSKNGDHLFVGTQAGRLFRIDNIKDAFSRAQSSIDDSLCVITTTELSLPDSGQIITSLSADPKYNDRLLVTRGSYGYASNVYYSTNATSDEAEFVSVQGNLPAFTVFSGILEMGWSKKAIIGTEHGIFTTDELEDGEVVWAPSNNTIGDIPVLALIQQSEKKMWDVFNRPNPTGGGGTIQDVYSGADNYGCIYAATYGRGIFRDDTYLKAVGINEHNLLTENVQTLTVFPNPATGNTTIEFKFENTTKASLRIFDFNGRLVYESSDRYPKGKNTINYNVASLNPGTYVVQLTTATTAKTSKLVVIH